MRTKEELLARAPIIACTLAGLASQRGLLQRSFDIVIVDEVANASAPQVLLAASRGRRSVALVDFLQNAPIAETDDPVGDAAEVLVAWQRKDIFALAGITDRHSAEQHPHCVALRRQYRYPSVIANIVNRFCYDGLLESHRQSSVDDGPTATFVDTSKLSNYSLRERDGS